MDKQGIAVELADVLLTSFEMQTAFKIKTQSGTGTSFLYGKDQGYFYVTARHLIDGTQVGDLVYFARVDGWHASTVTAIFVPDNEHDVAVFVTEFPWSGKKDFDTKVSVYPGQAVKFLGFPHGLDSNYPTQNGFTTPLVRSAHFSGVIEHKGLQITVLDGFNNPGYSGGPCYSCGEDGRPSLLGVISSYRYELQSHSLVYRKNSSGDFEPLPDYMVKLNSGMVYITGRKDCDELFAKVNQFQPQPSGF